VKINIFLRRSIKRRKQESNEDLELAALQIFCIYVVVSKMFPNSGVKLKYSSLITLEVHPYYMCACMHACTCMLTHAHLLQVLPCLETLVQHLLGNCAQAGRHTEFIDRHKMWTFKPYFYSRRPLKVTGCEIWWVRWLWHECDLCVCQELLHCQMCDL
jgi:hypothetical protein